MTQSPVLKLELPHIQGESVLALQMRLGMRGITVAADAVFGYGTESAVKEFQRRNALAQTGQVDGATHELLFGKDFKEKTLWTESG